MFKTYICWFAPCEGARNNHVVDQEENDAKGDEGEEQKQGNKTDTPKEDGRRTKGKKNNKKNPKETLEEDDKENETRSGM